MASERKARRTTLDDIAKQSGVSAKTVSLALKNDPSVAIETRKRIQELARQMGYSPKRVEERAFGLIVPYLSHIPHVELITFLRHYAFVADAVILISETTGNLEVERRLVSEFDRRGVDGLILISPRLRPEEIENMAINKRPVVTVNLPIGEHSRFSFASVEVDNEAGAYEATRHLLSRGHRRIAHFAGRYASSSAKDRLTGYRRALEESNLFDEQLVIDIGAHRPNFEAGYQQCCQMLAHAQNREAYPDSILAYNDMVAIGALNALEKNRLKVPRDVSLVGFDNVQLGQYEVPALTTVDPRWERVAQLAISTLARLVEGTHDDSETRHHKVSPVLVLKDSVKPRTYN